MSEINEGIRIKSWKEWRQGISNAKERIKSLFGGKPSSGGDEDAQRRIDATTNNNQTNNNQTDVKPPTTNNNQTNNNQTDVKPSTDHSASTPNLADKTGSSKLINKDGSNIFDGGPNPEAVRSGELDKQNRELNKTSNPSGKPLPKPRAVKPGSARADMIARNKEIFGSKPIDRLITKNAAFQASKKSGSNYSRKDFIKDFPDSNAAKDARKSKRITQVMDLESYDAYDLVLEHLTSTHQVESVKEAHYVMMEMDADIIKAIVDESIERQAKDREKLSQPHATPGNRREHEHTVDSAMTDHLPRKGKGRMRPASKKEIRTSAIRDARKTNN